MDNEGFAEDQLYNELMGQIKETNSDDLVLNLLKRLHSYILANENLFNSMNVKIRNFKVSILLFISNYIKYLPDQIEFYNLIGIIINDREAKNKCEIDYRPKFEKIDEIESLSKNILSEIFLKDNPRELSELISKHFYEETGQKELLNLFHYFNNCFKKEIFNYI